MFWQQEKASTRRLRGDYEADLWTKEMSAELSLVYDTCSPLPTPWGKQSVTKQSGLSGCCLETEALQTSPVSHSPLGARFAPTAARPAVWEGTANLLPGGWLQGPPGQAQLGSQAPAGAHSFLWLPSERLGAHRVAGDVARSVCCWFRTEKSFGSATGLKPMTRPGWMRMQDFWCWGQYSHTGTQPDCLRDGEKAKQWSRLGEKALRGEGTGTRA